MIVGVMLLPLRGVIVKAKRRPLARQTADALKIKILCRKRDYINTCQGVELSLEYAKVKPLSYVPFLGIYIKDGLHVVNAGLAVLMLPTVR